MEKPTISMSPAAQARAYQMAQRKKEKRAARKSRQQNAFVRGQLRVHAGCLLEFGEADADELKRLGLKISSCKAQKRLRLEKEFRKLVDSIEF